MYEVKWLEVGDTLHNKCAKDVKHDLQVFSTWQNHSLARETVEK
jgi:hypothetical protein